jgi:hypothetical protein
LKKRLLSKVKTLSKLAVYTHQFKQILVVMQGPKIAVIGPGSAVRMLLMDGATPQPVLNDPVNTPQINCA